MMLAVEYNSRVSRPCCWAVESIRSSNLQCTKQRARTHAHMHTRTRTQLLYPRDQHQLRDEVTPKVVHHDSSIGRTVLY